MYYVYGGSKDSLICILGGLNDVPLSKLIKWDWCVCVF